MAINPLTDYAVKSAPEGATPKKLIEKAIELRPLLREQQADTEKRGYYSLEVRNQLNDAGFYAAIQPKMFGGLESSLSDYYRMIIELARGCPSTAWCYALGTGKTMMLTSFYPESVQRDIYQRVGVIHGGHGPGRSTATPVEGGYVINGTFNYCSGIPYSNHLMGTAPVNGQITDQSVNSWSADKMNNLIEFVLPRGDGSNYEVLEDWGDGRTLGLNGTGSHSVRVENQFVPTEFTILDVGHNKAPLRDPQTGTEGTRLHGNPMYLGYLEFFLTGEVASVQVGIAQAMIDEMVGVLRTKKGVRGLYGNSKSAQDDFGEAVKLADGAQAIVMQAIREGEEMAQEWYENRVLPDEYRLWKCANQFQLAIRMSWESGVLAFRQAGSSSLKRGERIQRYFRDLAQERPQSTTTGGNYRDTLVRARLGLDADGKLPETGGDGRVTGATRA
ncbi:acyl-CoA dehydrogenase family protein [Glaciibacter sp. 2TAF33]|uniref:acyl-CoA dehydrogenase family protein n=1 Tax=Glaciibacter sp. 2TAF33 TaxID=3233015 RepID=UPI003F934D46